MGDRSPDRDHVGGGDRGTGLDEVGAMRISNQGREILKFLEGKSWTSPTEIGHTLKGEGYHSQWASPKCLLLVRQGLLKRNKKGWYRLK